MWHHFVNLLARSWANVLASLSTSTLNIILFSLASPVITFVITLIVVSRKHPERTLVDHAKESIWPTMIGLAVPLSLLAIVFGWKTVTTTYDDHLALAATVKTLQNAPKPICPSSAPCLASAANLEKRNIQKMLTKLSEKGSGLREEWRATEGSPVPIQRPYADRVHEWHAEIESYLRTIPRGPAYSARLNGAVRTGSGGYTLGINSYFYDEWDLLASDLAMLNEFINDPQLGEP